MLLVFETVDIVDIVVVVIVVRSHFSPLNPGGHSHVYKPSSLVNDVHLPPFSHVFGFFSQ